MKKLFFLYLFNLYLTLCVWGQISGIVKDASTDEPLVGALVMGLQDSSITDRVGRFKIETAGAAISVRYLGYDEMTIQLAKQSTITIRLKPSNTILGAVIVSSGSRGLSLNQTPTSINVINQYMLLRDAPFTFTNSINRLPGVFMSSGTYNTNRITIRGIGSRSPYGTTKVKAYYDEIPLTDGSGNSTVEDIDQGLIERIEVIKGPNSSAYGAGLGGTIRLHSINPQPLKTCIKMGWTQGSYGTKRYTTQASHHDGTNSFSLTYSQLNSDGYRENSQLNRDQAGVKTKLRLTDQSTLSVIGQFTRLKAYIPSSINAEDYENEPQKAAFTWAQSRGYESYNKGIIGITYHHSWESEWDLKSSVFGKYRDAHEPRPFNILSENTQSIGIRNILSKRWDMVDLVMGMETYADRYAWQTFENNYTPESNGSVEGNQLSDNKELRQYFNSFAETTLKVTKKLRLLGGINLNYTRYDYTDLAGTKSQNNSGAYDFNPVISPKLGLSYEVESGAVFTNISHGFSPPSLEETLYPEGQINPNIKPESGWNFELGTRGKVADFNYDITAYYMKISDLLVARRTAEDAYIGVNAGRNDHFGIDALLNYKIIDTRSMQLLAFTSIAFMDFKFSDFEDNDQNFSGNRLTGIPQWIMNPGVEFSSSSGLYANLNAQYVGEIPLNDANSIFADRYVILRTKLGYTRQFKKLDFDFYAGIDNIGDTKYASMLLINATGFNGAAPRYYYPGLPRNYFAGIMLGYCL